MIEFLKNIKNHDLINDIKITAELNERCEYIYTLIGPKKHKNVKNVAGIKNIKNVYYVYARSYQCSNY